MSVDARLERLRLALAKAGRKVGLPLTEAEVARFEAKAGVTLPDDYRQFVTRVGNGGPGRPPEYGLMALGEVPRDHHRSRDQVLGRMKLPFPLTEAWIWESDDDPDPDEVDAVEHGVLHLGTDGCGMYWVLVVSGEARGTVWLLTGEGATPCSPPLDFLGWMEAALDAGESWPTCVLGE